MKKRLLLVLVFSILAITAYVGYRSYQKIKVQEAFSDRIQQLPDPRVFQWVERTFLNQGRPTVVLFFHPDCEHCQYEAKAIAEQKNAFTNTDIWWVSAADRSAISTFSQAYGLSQSTNMYLAHIPGEDIMKTFGSISVPHIFIYDNHGVLQKQFKGETRIDAILKHINTQN